jgi:short subunit dehydrogenase-like uncharacterized protein
MSRQDRPVDVAIYGATGFTGRLVVDYFNKTYGTNGDVKWAMAGRSKDKLKQICEEMNVSADVPMIIADSSDTASMEGLTQQCKVILTTVGPYQLYGSDLVGACAANGTDYVDLCGEPNWMHDMINKHESAAKKSGARIVFSCGFDSVPFDLGVFYLQQQATEKLGKMFSTVKGRVRKMKGTWSGGTLASLRATLSAVKSDKAVLAVMRNPFSLTSGFVGPDQPKGSKPYYDESVSSWVAPFVMASINTKNVHRSNMLLGHSYGTGFVYDEMIMTGPGDKGEERAKMVAADTSMNEDETQPGEGPSKEAREAGFYDVLMVGEDPNNADSSIVVSVIGDMDPGYGSTSKIISESAVCLSKNQGVASGGIWTPAAAMGAELIKRLQKNAGVKFAVEKCSAKSD